MAASRHEVRHRHWAPKIIVVTCLVVTILASVSLAGAARFAGWPSEATVAVATPASSTGWSLLPSPNPPGSNDSELFGLACSTGTDCIGVGYHEHNGNEVTLAESWNGAAWTVMTTPNPANSPLSFLFSISCVSTTECMAVGQYDYKRSGTPVPLAEEWNGATWTISTPPYNSKARGEYLWGVSCTSATACQAIGYTITATQLTVPLAEVWNGTSWSTQTIPRPIYKNKLSPTAPLYGVSCTSATACTAVGYYEDHHGEQQPLVEAWNGSAWSIPTTPYPSGTTYGSYLSGVSCASTTACTAVGYSNAQGTLAESWDGTAWTIQSTPNAAAGPIGSVLDAVSCTSSTACIAVGYGSDNQTLAEAWDGSAWSIQTTPNVIGVSVLRAVTCTSSTVCAAVGDYFEGQGATYTLAEQYSG